MEMLDRNFRLSESLEMVSVEVAVEGCAHALLRCRGLSERLGIESAMVELNLACVRLTTWDIYLLDTSTQPNEVYWPLPHCISRSGFNERLLTHPLIEMKTQYFGNALGEEL